MASKKELLEEIENLQAETARQATELRGHDYRERERQRREHRAQQEKRKAAEQKERRDRINELAAGKLDMKAATDWGITSEDGVTGIQVFVPLDAEEQRVAYGYLRHKDAAAKTRGMRSNASPPASRTSAHCPAARPGSSPSDDSCESPAIMCRAFVVMGATMNKYAALGLLFEAAKGKRIAVITHSRRATVEALRDFDVPTGDGWKLRAANGDEEITSPAGGRITFHAVTSSVRGMQLDVVFLDAGVDSLLELDQLTELRYALSPTGGIVRA